MDMTLITQSVLASGPEIIIIIGACVALMLSLVPHPRQEAALVGFSLVMIILAAAMSYSLNDRPQSAYAGMFVVDDFSTFFKMLLYLGTALTVLMSGKYLAKEGVVKGEYYVLLLFALVGGDDHGFRHRPVDDLYRPGIAGPVYLCPDRFSEKGRALQ